MVVLLMFVQLYGICITAGSEGSRHWVEVNAGVGASTSIATD